MLNLMTNSYFTDKFGKPPTPIDIDFGLNILDCITAPSAAEIVKSIDNVILLPNGILSKFYAAASQVLPTTLLSSGCKTALLINAKKQKSVQDYITISECGPKAMRVCLELLDDTKLVGVIGVSADMEGPMDTLEICLNEKPVPSWFSVLIACLDEEGVRDE